MRINWKISFVLFIVTFLMFVYSVSTNSRNSTNSANSTDSPYPDFELKLRNQICECISLSRLSNEDQFIEEYENCSKEISNLLINGLDEYSESSNISKTEYLRTIQDVVLKLSKQCHLIRKGK